MQVHEIVFVERRDTRFQDVGADEFADRGREGVFVGRGREIRDYGPVDAQDDAAAAAVAHADCVGEEEEEGLEDGGVGEAELAHRGVRGGGVAVGDVGGGFFSGAGCLGIWGW